MNKICFVIPYFGKLPNYFDLWLESARKNDLFDFLFFTDQKIRNEKNIKIMNLSFEDFRNRLKSKLGREIKISNPYKICDYRPSFGYVFGDFLKLYEFWGYVDLDIILGDINNLLYPVVMKGYEYSKFYENGHLSIYRNNNKINNMYKKTGDYICFKDISKLSMNCIFDEKFGIGRIFYENKEKTFYRKNFADINKKYFNFKTTYYDNRYKNFYLEYLEGHLFIISKNEKKEVIYAHFQKRFMTNNVTNFNHYYIYPNSFDNNLHFDKKYFCNLYTFKYYLKYVFSIKLLFKEIMGGKIKFRKLLKKYNCKKFVRMGDSINKNVIYIATHKNLKYNLSLKNYEYLFCGASKFEQNYTKYQRDDEGDNISELNSYYSELTGIYWIWKNCDMKNVGLVHYRRFFVSHSGLHLLSSKEVNKILIRHDVIVPKKQRLKIPVKKELCKYIDSSYIENIENIIKEISPEYIDTFEDFMNGNVMFLFNMFVGNKKILDPYFDWIFKILFSFQKSIILDEKNKRAMGYISEWLFNVWIKRNGVKIVYRKTIFLESNNIIKKTYARFLSRNLGRKKI